ncbi:hypothetical protein R1sor_024830 [Riccia sorocarpa]|uniref:Uncharacterized protein n=1 Tax=Riccia sorocarpa TaxID=122646 RepID=A0ABD3GXM4_9MARC
MVKAKSNTLEFLRSGEKWQEFVLDCELTLKALEKRMTCSLDMRSLPLSEVDYDEGLSIKGVPTMRLQKKDFLDSLKEELTKKTSAFVRNIKISRLRLSPPSYYIKGEKFHRWTRTPNGVKSADWAVLWDYHSTT